MIDLMLAFYLWPYRRNQFLVTSHKTLKVINRSFLQCDLILQFDLKEKKPVLKTGLKASKELQLF